MGGCERKWKPGQPATTNEECVRNIMNFSRYGGLVQAFVMVGLDDYCRLVMEAEPTPAPPGSAPIVSRETWREIAEEVHGKLEQFARRFET